jgi:hypothetical protein
MSDLLTAQALIDTWPTEPGEALRFLPLTARDALTRAQAVCLLHTGLYAVAYVGHRSARFQGVFSELGDVFTAGGIQ